MKKLFFITIVAIMGTNCWAGKITLLGKDVMSKKLREHEFGHYVDKTDLVNQIAGKEHEVSDLVQLVGTVHQGYCASLDDKEKSERGTDAPYLLYVILSDDFQAYQEAAEIINQK